MPNIYRRLQEIIAVLEAFCTTCPDELCIPAKDLYDLATAGVKKDK